MDYKKTSYLYVGITVAVFILINLISMNWFIRFDLTDNKMYSLSASSKSTIKKIDDPLTIDLYFSDDLPGQLQNNKRYIQDLLEEYVAYSNNINFYFIPNNEDFSSKAQSDGIQSQDIQVIENDEISFKTIFMGMKIRFGGKSEVIQLLGVETGLEYMLTKSIKKLIDQKTFTIGIAQAGSKTYNNENLNTILSERFKITNKINLDSIPAVDLLIINGIEGDLSINEKSGLENYIYNGGSALIAQGRIKPDIQTQQGSIIQSNFFNILDSLGLYIEENLILDQNCKSLMAQQKMGRMTVQTQIDYPFIPAIDNFNSYENITTGLEGIQMIQIAFPSEITYTKKDSMFLPLLQTSNQSAVMTDFFNLGALPEMNPILNNLNESSKIIGGRLQTPYGGNIFLITDSDFFSDESIANMRLVRGDFNENYTFIENLIDVMVGDEELVALRSREILVRPLSDDVIGKENSSIRTTWKWIDLLLPVFLTISYGLIRKSFREKRAKHLMEFYG
tara:strand:+ start:5943 stop:7460 length:1518 start_codon:yes stop_codon:yes gene_type:complete